MQLTRKDTQAEVDGIHFQLPDDVTALSLLGVNSVQDGDDFQKDGWVYRDGKPVRKWFIRLSCDDQERIWEPKFENVVLLEAKRWKYYERAMRLTLPTYQELDQQCKKAKKFGGYAKFSEKSEGLVEFSCGLVGTSWSWVDKKPNNINQELVDKYFSVEKRNREVWHRYHLFDKAFQEGITRKYWKVWLERRKEKNDNFVSIHLVINGRDYWLGNVGGNLNFTSLPENTVNIVETLQ